MTFAKPFLRGCALLAGLAYAALGLAQQAALVPGGPGNRIRGPDGPGQDRHHPGC